MAADPSNPIANKIVAQRPASGAKAIAASVAVCTLAWLFPSVAAVATSTKKKQMAGATAPQTASARSAGACAGVARRSDTSICSQ